VWSVATRTEALVWLLDPAMNWPEGAQTDSPSPVTGAEVIVEGIEDGVYDVEWWDTREGRPIAGDEARCEGGRCALAPPEFQVDVAARVRKR